MISKLVGETLNEKIIEKGFKYAVYAEMAGVSQGYVSKVINGSVDGIKLDTLEKLVKPLDLTVVEFLTEVEKKKLVNISITEEEIKGIIEDLRNGENKKNFLKRLRKAIPQLPEIFNGIMDEVIEDNIAEEKQFMKEVKEEARQLRQQLREHAAGAANHHQTA